MKKILIFVFLTVLSFGIFQTPDAHGYFRFNMERETRFVEGIRHIEAVGQIDYDGVVSNQVLNYIGINVKNNEDIHLVVGDNYYDHQFYEPGIPFDGTNGRWRMSSLPLIIDNIHNRYDSLEVLAAVNGDFYDINNTGRPTSIHIRNFEVIHRGSTSRAAVGFKDDGEVVYGYPQYGDYELMVFNDEGQLKGKMKVNRFNDHPRNSNEVGVYFDYFQNALPEDYTKVFLKGIDTKYTNSGKHFFAKGSFLKQTQAVEEIGQNEIVVVGENLNSDQLIGPNDYVVIQQSLVGTFEGVRFAIGTDLQPLVENGKANLTLDAGAAWNFRAPRTAIGIMKDGTVFFVVVDGRMLMQLRDGVTLRELAQIMEYFGADRAYNLDGGGSSTMMLMDRDADDYEVLNTPSDGRLRSLSNGIAITRGALPQVPDPIPAWPDTRTKLAEVSNIYVDHNQVLHFQGISGAIGYDINVNGKIVTVTDNEYQLTLGVGVHEVSVRAKGGAEYQSSEFTTPMLHQIYPHTINLFVDMIKEYARSYPQG